MIRSAMPAGLPAVLVEAFAERPCSGNGAAVVLLDRPLPEVSMQALAASLRQSETAFLLEGAPGWMLRWFTPTCEVPLCGHATLAAALALAHWGRLDPEQPLLLHSRSGALPIRLCAPAHGAAARAAIQLPSAALLPAPVPPDLGGLLEASLGCGPEAYWTSALYSVALVPPSAPLAAMASPADRLRGPLRQGLVLMQSLSADPAAPRVGVDAADYQLRFFAPGLGIPEDPVTGSAHALVAPWWLQRLNRQRIVGWQCSDRPGGMVCEAASSGMIRLIGSGHLLWDGTLRMVCNGLPPGSPGCPVGDASDPEQWRVWFTATRCAC